MTKTKQNISAHSQIDTIIANKVRSYYKRLNDPLLDLKKVDILYIFRQILEV